MSTAPATSRESPWPTFVRPAARYPDDPGVRRLIDRLTAASGEFRDLWADQDVRVRRSTHKRLNHPLVGWLDLDCEALHDPDRDQWILFYTASSGGTSVEALRLLKVIGTQDLASQHEVGGGPVDDAIDLR